MKELKISIRRARYLRQFSRRAAKPTGQKRAEPYYHLHDPGFCEMARRSVLGIVLFKTSEAVKNPFGAPMKSKRVFLIQPANRPEILRYPK